MESEDEEAARSGASSKAGMSPTAKKLHGTMAQDEEQSKGSRWQMHDEHDGC